ncbi:MAG: pseudouridine synthase [Bacteroidales bacterium]|nr:pseudouridine synthase [Bacteroidales bacterium]
MARSENTGRSASRSRKPSSAKRPSSAAGKRSFSPKKSSSAGPKKSFSPKGPSTGPRKSFSRSASAGPKKSFSSRGPATGAKRTSSPRSAEAPKRSFSPRGTAAPKRASTSGRTSAAIKKAFSTQPARTKRTRSDFEQVRSQLEGREAVVSARKPRVEAYTPKPRKPKAKGEEGIRLNRFIANSGLCSRREADEYILQGVITINGQTVTELGTKVFQTDEVRFDGKIIQGEEKVYIIMNKPKNCVTTTDDPHARKTVMDLIAGKCPQRVYPVGRLDRDTTGVLLLTNDGDMTEKLTHPSYNKKKIYHVFLDRNLNQADFDKILKGVYLDDGMINADALSYIDGDQTQVGIEIHSGRNRIVRRIFEALGYKVEKLDRVYFAGLTKKNLRRGQWRFLTEKELGILKMGSYE